MSTLAVQTAIGKPGEKATSELSYDFTSLVRVNDFYYGTNTSGLYLVDNGLTDLAEDIESSITLATTDFSFRNPKNIRFLYVGLEGVCDQIVFVNTFVDDIDNGIEEHTLIHTGIQRIRVPIQIYSSGRYWRITISSKQALRIDSVEAQLILRSSGIIGY